MHTVWQCDQVVTSCSVKIKNLFHSFWTTVEWIGHYSLYLQKLFTFTRPMKPIQLTKPKRLRHIFIHPTHFKISHHAMALKSKFKINSLKKIENEIPKQTSKNTNRPILYRLNWPRWSESDSSKLLSHSDPSWLNSFQRTLSTELWFQNKKWVWNHFIEKFGFTRNDSQTNWSVLIGQFSAKHFCFSRLSI